MATLSDIKVTLGLEDKDFRQGLKKASKNVEKFGKDMQDVGQNLASTISAPLGVIGAVAGKTASDFDTSQAQIQASLGVTEDKASELNGVVKDLWRDGFGQGVADVETSMSTVIRRVKGMENASKKSIKSMTGDVLTLRKTYDADVNDSVKAITGLMRNFGIEGQKATDLITTGFQDGLNYSGDFLDTINEYGSQFKAIGFNSEQMFSILKEGAESGAWSLDKAGDMVAEFNKKAKDGSKTTRQAFQNLGLDADVMADKIAQGGTTGKKAFNKIVNELLSMEKGAERNQTAVGLFGTQFEDLEIGALQALSGVENKYSSVEGATKRAGQTVKNDFAGLMTRSLRTVQDALKPFGDSMLQIAETILPPILTKVQQLSDKFSNLSPTTQKIITVFAGVTALIPILLMGFGAITSAVGMLTGALGISLTTIGLVTGAFAILGTALVVAWTKSETFRNIVTSGFQKIKTFALEVFGIVATFVKQKIAEIKAFWDVHGASIQKAFKRVFGIIQTVVQTVFPIVKSIVMDTIRNVMNIIDGLLTFIKGFVKLVTGVINGDWALAWQGLQDMVLGAVKAVWNFVKVWLLGKVLKIFGAMFRGIKAIGGKLWKAIKSPFVKGFRLVKAWVLKLKRKVRDKFTAMKNTVSDIGGKLLTKITSPFKKGWESITSWVDKIKRKVGGMFKGIKTPHFNVSGSLNPKEWIKGNVPKIGIDWYESGGIIEGTSSGKVVGVGENGGDEAIIPMSKRAKMLPFANAIAGMISNGQDETKSEGGRQYHINFNKPVVIREEADIERLADEMEKKRQLEERAEGIFSYS